MVDLLYTVLFLPFAIVALGMRRDAATGVSVTLGVTPSTALRMAERLESLTLVDRRVNPDNRREVVLRLRSSSTSSVPASPLSVIAAVAVARRDCHPYGCFVDTVR